MAQAPAQPPASTQPLPEFSSLGSQVVFAPDVSVMLWRTLQRLWDTSGSLPLEKAGQGGYTVTVSSQPAPAVAPQARPLGLPLPERQVTAWVLGQEVWCEGAYLKVCPETAQARLLLPDAAPDLALVLLTEIHRAAGWVPLHAAALSAGGQAAVVLGHSGAGKSTAALRLRQLGATIMAEDRTYWHPSTQQVVGLDHSIRVFPQSLQVLGYSPDQIKAALAGLPQDAKAKYLLPLAPAAPATLLGVWLLLPHGSTPAGNRVLSPAERVRALWDATGAPLTEAGGAVQQGVMALLKPLEVIYRQQVPLVGAALGLDIPA